MASMVLLASLFDPSLSYQSLLTPWFVQLLLGNYFVFLLFLVVYISWRRPEKVSMARTMAKWLLLFNIFALVLSSVIYRRQAGQSDVTTQAIDTGSMTTMAGDIGSVTTQALDTGSVTTQAIVTGSVTTQGSASTTLSWQNEQFTVPASADQGANLIPNILDPDAINPQDVCPGYKASNVQNTEYGITADLTIAGEGCNVYGNDIAHLNLTVEWQSDSRLHIEITPTYIGAKNSSWFILPEALIPKPENEAKNGSASFESDIGFSWSNGPTFSFTVTRLSTGDILFTTENTVIVYEDQFIEFGSAMPDNYNLYGMGEAIHEFRLGNNFTRTFYAADAGDPIDYNIYSNHPFYLDTRYFEVDEETGEHAYVANATDAEKTYKSYSHGSFMRNAHPMEALFGPTNITWRALGGNIDLYFYAGPTQVEVTKQYQLSTIGLPAMQQYWTFGFHQCRWGYRNWTELQQIVDEMEQFQIPMDTIWYVLLRNWLCTLC